MILWIAKLLNSVRKAIAGRKYPAQLAWAVSFGLLLGIVPHGNLLALVLLVVVLSLRVNHAMAGLTAVGASFAAAYLDPYAHRVGDYVLTHPQVTEAAYRVWELPLMPWTDLNNTVVMGSFVIGLVALLPVFGITYPVFRLMARRQMDEDRGAHEKESVHGQHDRTFADPAHRVSMIDGRHEQVPAPHHNQNSRPAPIREENRNRTNEEQVDFVEVDDVDADQDGNVAVETRIDVIRMQDHIDAQSGPTSQSPSGGATSAASQEQQPMDEALNYLLRQLRDSHEKRNAA